MLRESGRIDILVNNAGVMCPGEPPLGSCDHDDMENELIIEQAQFWMWT